MAKKTINVTSENQSGGVTAGKVNVDNRPELSSNDIPKTAKWIAWVLATVVAIFTIYAFFWS